MSKKFLLIVCVALVLMLAMTATISTLAAPNPEPPQNQYGDRFEHPPEPGWGAGPCAWDHCQYP